MDIAMTDNGPEDSAVAEQRRLETVAAFIKDMEHLINRYSMENASNTPDFILAEYLANCLGAFNIALRARTKWYEPEAADENGPVGPV